MKESTPQPKVDREKAHEILSKNFKATGATFVDVANGTANPPVVPGWTPQEVVALAKELSRISSEK